MIGKFKIVNETVRDDVAKKVAALPVDVLHEVLIHPYELDRSAEQKGYYFRIAGIIANDTGYTKAEMHDVFKVELLMPIYMADEKKVAYHQRIRAIQNAFREGAINYQMKRDLITAVTSTNDAKIKHMKALIDEVHHFAAAREIRLPVMEYA